MMDSRPPRFRGLEKIKGEVMTDKDTNGASDPLRLEVAYGEVRPLPQLTTTVYQVAIHSGERRLGQLDFLLLSGAPCASDDLSRAFAGHLWDLGDVFDGIFNHRGRIPDVFEGIPALIVEAVDIDAPSRTSQLHRATSIFLARYLPDGAWVYLDPEDECAAQAVGSHRALSAAPGSYSHSRFLFAGQGLNA